MAAPAYVPQMECLGARANPHYRLLSPIDFKGNSEVAHASRILPIVPHSFCFHHNSSFMRVGIYKREEILDILSMAFPQGAQSMVAVPLVSKSHSICTDAERSKDIQRAS